MMKKYFPQFVLTTSILILFSPLLFTERVVFWGTPSLQFVPWWTFAWESISSGEFPLWNPLLGMGAPLIANYQSALFYPLHWLYGIGYLISGSAGIAQTIEVTIVLHLLISGYGIIALLRRLGVKNLGQTIGGLAFALSGYLVSRASFLSINAVLAWMPWVMVFTTDTVSRFHKYKSLFKLSLVIGLMLLAGHAQLSWYSLLLAGAWLLFLSWKPKNELKQNSLRIINNGWMFGLAVLIGGLISAVQLLPTAQYLMQSHRANAVEVDFAMTYSFWPYRFLTLFAPNMFGNPAHGDFWGYANYWEDAIYIGLLPILVVLGILIRMPFKGRRRKLSDHSAMPDWLPSRYSIFSFYLIVSGVSLLLALGKNTPVFPFLYRYIPTFDMFQAPTRISIWAVFSMPVLAGIGIETWRKPEGRTLYWTRLGLMGSVAISIGLVIGWMVLSEVELTAIRSLAMTSILATGFCIIRLFTPVNNWTKKGLNTWWKLAVVSLVSVDLIIIGWGLIPANDVEFYKADNSVSAEIRENIGMGRLYIPIEDETYIKYQQFFTFVDFNSHNDWLDLRYYSVPNANLYDDIPLVNNYDPLLPGRYRSWVTFLEELPEDQQPRWLDLMNVTLIETAVEGDQIEVQIQQNQTLGRVRYLHCAIAVENGDEALDKMISGAIDLEKYLILEDGSLPSSSEDCTEFSRDVEIQGSSNNRIRIYLEEGEPGYILLSDVWYPGWKATANNEEFRIYRGDYLFKAIEVDAKEQTIELQFAPGVFIYGLIISIIALVIVVVILII